MTEDLSPAAAVPGAAKVAILVVGSTGLFLARCGNLAFTSPVFLPNSTGHGSRSFWMALITAAAVVRNQEHKGTVQAKGESLAPKNKSRPGGLRGVIPYDKVGC